MDTTADSRAQNLSIYLLFSCTTAALSAFNAGYNTGVPNQPQATISQCRNIPSTNRSTYFHQCLPMTLFMWGLCVGLFAVGGLLGGLSSSKLSTVFGRKGVLMYNNSVFIIGGVLLATANSVVQFAIGRVVVGFGRFPGNDLAKRLVPNYKVSDFLHCLSYIALLPFFPQISQFH